ncbi:hypothetical protein CU097_007770 [Rhizopus azygosporus]|uniref:Uncharacterized protein n=1 Tax=Rhizopus azygosporus TaxID=86630 RepID=A0A367J6Z7_RHIAZ|nr:hypothetical protein CU097_007770 [Rhizopus azygosporus]
MLCFMLTYLPWKSPFATCKLKSFLKYIDDLLISFFSLDLIESPCNYMLFKQSERPSAVYAISRKKCRADLSLFRTDCIIKTTKMRLYILKRIYITCYLLVSSFCLTVTSLILTRWRTNVPKVLL